MHRLRDLRVDMNESEEELLARLADKTQEIERAFALTLGLDPMPPEELRRFRQEIGSWPSTSNLSIEEWRVIARRTAGIGRLIVERHEIEKKLRDVRDDEIAKSKRRYR